MSAPIHDLHVSNLLTYVSLASAVVAIAAVVDGGNAPLAGAALAVAALADAFDGRFARRFARTARQQRVGHELDSLVDAVTFGLAPVVVLSAGAWRASGPFAADFWIAAGFYLVAVVTRLSSYNVDGDETRFVGIPTPAAALLCATSLLVPVPSWAAAWPLVLGGILMIAPVAFPRPRGVGLAAFGAWAVMVAATLAFQ